MNELNREELQSALKYLDSWLALNFDNSRLPALQVAIQHDDKIVYSRAFGYANIETKEEATTDHIFRIASHSKTFTAVALLQLVEQGKLNLDDTVQHYLEWFQSSVDKRISQVTIRQLLNHTAGIIRDGDDADFWQILRDFPDKEELKEYVATSKLVYESDEKFKYSNFGFGYLGLVIEAVSGKSYREYVTEHIVKKLGLQSTGPDLNEKALQKLVNGYGIELFKKKRRRFEHIDTRDLSAATGFYSTAEDLCKYFATHFIGNTTLLKDSSKRLMQHGYWKSENSDEQYGLGLVNYPRKGWHIYGHSGGFPGFITNTQFDPKKKLVISVLTNVNSSNAKSICTKLVNIIDTFQQDTPENTTNVRDLTKFEGRFYSAWGPTDVVCVGSKLFSIDPLFWTEFNDAQELSVVDDSTLRIEKASGYSSPGELVKYTFDNKGKPVSIIGAGTTMVQWKEAKKKGWFS